MRAFGCIFHRAHRLSPSTFLRNKKGMIVFEKISHPHGDRMSAQDALDHLSAN